MPGRDSADERFARALADADGYRSRRARGTAEPLEQWLSAHDDLRELLEPLIEEAGDLTVESSAPASEPDATEATEPRRFAHFQILGSLGGGGMGDVYLALDEQLGRQVALKMIRPEALWSQDTKRRFHREALAVGRLDHPNICKLYEAGEHDGWPFMALQYIPGDTLAQRIEQARRAAAERGTALTESAPATRANITAIVALIEQVARALHHAHEHGLVHRDIKPGNIMIGSDGQPVVLDFGLVRDVLDLEASLASSSRGIGTPLYMSPEQVRRTGPVDARTDVYSLGVTLYECLTHERPFDAPTEAELADKILTNHYRDPRAHNHHLPPELSLVIACALDRDAERRYRTALAIAEDLRRVLDLQPVQARPIGTALRLRRWAQRNPTLLGVGALAGLALVGLAVATERAIEAHEQQGIATRRADEASILAGVALARTQNFRGAWAALMPLERGSPDATTRAALDELFRRYPCLASQPLVSRPDERVTLAEFSSDGQRLLTRHEQRLGTGPMSWHLRLWTVPTPQAPIPQQLWRSPECARLPVAAHVGHGLTVAWALQGEHSVSISGPDRDTSHIRFAECVRLLVPASKPGFFGAGLESRIRICDADGRVGGAWPLPRDSFHTTILDDVLVWCRPSGTHWTILSAALGAKPIDIGVGMPRVHLDPDDQTRMVVTTETWITAWRIIDGKLEPDGRRANPLPSGLQPSLVSNVARGLDANEGRFGRLRELPLRQSNLVSARLFEAGAGRFCERYIVAVEEQVLRIWGMPEPRQLDAEASGLEIARFEPGASRLWGAGPEMLAAWSFDAGDVGSREDVKIPSEIGDAIDAGMYPIFSGLAFDPGRATLACARADVTMGDSSGWVFVLPTDELQGAEARSYPCSSEPSWVALSPDSRQIALAARTGSVELWTYDSRRRELTDQNVLPRLTVGATRLSCVRYLGDRFLLASVGGGRGGILRWDLDDRGAQPVPVGPPEIRQALRCLAVSHDGQLVATGGDDRGVRVLRVVWLRGLPTLEPEWHAEHGAPVFAVAFAMRDGARILASADSHGEIRLWDANTAEPRGIVREAFESDDEMILSLDFSPDGRHLAASQRRGHVLLWDMDRPRRCLEGNRECADQLQGLQAESRQHRAR